MSEVNVTWKPEWKENPVETIHERNQSFSPEVKGLQLAWDSTSLGLLKECPRKYYLNMLEGWAPNTRAVPLSFGIYVHECFEIYDKAKAGGMHHEDAVRETVQYALTVTTKKDEAGNMVFWEGDNSIRTRETLVRAMVWYLEHFKDDPATTIILDNGKPAVELSFRIELPFVNGADDPFKLCGHLDRLCDLGGQVYVMDRKTTKSSLSDYYFAQYDPDTQMSCYSFGARVAFQKEAKGVIVDAIQLTQSFCRFHRRMIPRSVGRLDEWVNDVGYWLQLAEHYARTGYWPMNDKACHKFNGCDYREVCKSDPSLRGRMLNSDFKRKVWDPLESR